MLQPFISNELEASTKPFFSLTKTGGKGVGYDARLLPQVAEVYLRFRDDCLTKTGKVPDRYKGMITAADIGMTKWSSTPT